MNYHYILVLCALVISLSINAQLPDGSIAPDFTVTDVHGQSHNLYSYLDDGKTVFLDLFATWCPPCWSHHRSGAFDDLYSQYGPGGTDEVMVIAIETDFRTNVNCLYGSAGCNYSTQGDYVSGTSYPIADDASIGPLYSQSYYPTIYGICPNKRLTELGSMNSSGYYQWHLDNCAFKVSLLSKADVLCNGDATGHIELLASGGTGANYSYSWSNSLQDARIEGLEAGLYTCTVSDGASSLVMGPYEIGQPDALEIYEAYIKQPNCTQMEGQIELNITGGTEPYSVLWNDGGDGARRSELLSGTYYCTIYDAYDCTIVSDDFEIRELIVPEIQIQGDSGACAGTSISLEVDLNADSYEWSTGASDRRIEFIIEESQEYSVTATFSDGCTSSASHIVTINESLSIPTEYDFTLPCDETQLELDLDQVFEGHYTYELINEMPYSSLENGKILAIYGAGIVELQVKSGSCIENVEFQIEYSENLPIYTISGDDELNCMHRSIRLNRTSDSATQDDHEVQWFKGGTDLEYLSSEEYVDVVESGVYGIEVRNPTTQCWNRHFYELEQGPLSLPSMSVAWKKTEDSLLIYNVSKSRIDSYKWTLWNGDTVNSPQINWPLEGLPSTTLSLCLEATNPCGTLSNVCQSIDITDSSYYFQGTIQDHFSNEIPNALVEDYESGRVVECREDGSYMFSNISKNSNMYIVPRSQDLEMKKFIDVNDLSELADHILGKKIIQDPLLLYAADVNMDGKLNVMDLIKLRSLVLKNEGTLHRKFVRKISFDPNIQLDIGAIPDFVQLWSLQASHVKNDFVGILLGDLTMQDEDTGVALDGNELSRSESVRLAFEESQYVKKITIDKVHHPSEISINGEALEKGTYRLEGQHLEIILFSDDQEVLISRSEHLGERDHAKKPYFELFPTVADDELSIMHNISSEDGLVCQIINGLGVDLTREVHIDYDMGQAILHISNLEQGNYFIKIYSKNNIFIHQFIKR